MPVVFLIAAVAVLGGVFLAATGRGGEMAVEHPDHAPLDLGPVSAPDIALLRPPTALWGYNIQVTDEALDLIARAMRDRDVTIAQLQQELASRDVRDPGAGHVDVGNLYYTDPDAPRPDAPRPEFSQVPQALLPLEAPEAPQTLHAFEAREAPRHKAPGVLVAPLSHRAPPPVEATQPADVTQAAEAIQPPEAAEAIQPPEATQPADAIPAAKAARPADTWPASHDARVQGPQGSYDTHGWWAQQEEAAREEALRQAQAQARAGAEGRSGEAGSPGESGSPEAAGHPAGVPADRDDSGPGRTATRPNPAIASSSGTPDDDALAVEEEQGW